MKEPPIPMFDLTLPAGALPRSALSALVEGLTTTAVRWQATPTTRRNQP